MFKGLPRPIKHLPISSYKSKRNHHKKTHLDPFILPLKVIIGVAFLGFLLNYQPTLGFPPVKQTIVRAQVAESAPQVIEQTQTVSSKAIPIIFALAQLRNHYHLFFLGPPGNRHCHILRDTNSSVSRWCRRFCWIR